MLLLFFVPPFCNEGARSPESRSCDSCRQLSLHRCDKRLPQRRQDGCLHVSCKLLVLHDFTCFYMLVHAVMLRCCLEVDVRHNVQLDIFRAHWRGSYELTPANYCTQYCRITILYNAVQLYNTVHVCKPQYYAICFVTVEYLYPPRPPPPPPKSTEAARSRMELTLCTTRMSPCPSRFAYILRLTFTKFVEITKVWHKAVTFKL